MASFNGERADPIDKFHLTGLGGCYTILGVSFVLKLLLLVPHCAVFCEEVYNG